MRDFNYFLDRETLEVQKRGDPEEIDRRIIELLSKPDTLRVVRNALVFCVHLRVQDPELRSALSRALYEVARDIVATGDESEREVAQRAIHEATSVSDKAGELAALVAFMGPRNPDGVRRAALRALANSAFHGPVPRLSELHDLRCVVTATADDLCRADKLDTWGGPPMAIASVLAVRALGLSIVPWLVAFRSHPHILKEIEESLADMMEWWSWPVQARISAGLPS